MSFIGKYKHTLDPKGRVFVPKKFLSVLPETEPRHFTVTTGYEGCLVLYTASSWRKRVEQMKARAHGEREARDFKRLIFSSASQQSIDGSGRILIPEDLRLEAGLTREVMFVGMDDEIELWDHENWVRYHREVRPNLEKVGRGF